ncbi:MAG: DUF177 domain-containing protein [Candidatus Zixiibacteriota bacterium]
MKINLIDLKDELDTLQFQVSPQELDLKFEGADFSKPALVELTLRRNGDSYYCSGEAKTEVRLECSRCLEPYSPTLKAKFDFFVRVEKDRIQIEYQDQAEPLVFPGNQFFSVDSLIEEAILLSLPLKPLCSEDCKGLCPVCGANLNISTCQCKKEKPDPRWDKLKDRLKG